jgi:hypothetical protein
MSLAMPGLLGLFVRLFAKPLAWVRYVADSSHSIVSPIVSTAWAWPVQDAPGDEDGESLRFCPAIRLAMLRVR